MGIIKEDTDILDPTQLGHYVGPAVHLYNHDASSQSWYGSVLIACHTNALGNKRASMTYSAGGGAAQDVQADIMYQQDFGGLNWSVMRCAATSSGLFAVQSTGAACSQTSCSRSLAKKLHTCQCWPWGLAIHVSIAAPTRVFSCHSACR